MPQIKPLTQSSQLYAQAQQYIPGGVNSPVRAFGAVGGTPAFIHHAQGPYLFDEDNNRYIDYVGSWGPMILGHQHPAVVDAATQAIQRGISFGAPTAQETTLAKLICELIPSIETIRLVNSGTEATMTAIRLARGFTQKNKIIKFEGCYHGHNDALLVKAGSGALTFGNPSSAGIPNDFAKHTLVATFNDLNSVANYFTEYQNDIAAIILEPIAGNMNCVPANIDFLQGLRALCDQHQSLLIFDEVMTGFRVAKYSAQQHYQITPDLTCLGKIIGGGMPVGAFGGRRDIMQLLAPCGPVYQAGTLSGNPVAVACGIANLQQLTQAGTYEQLADKTNYLLQGIKQAAHAAGISLTTNHIGSMFGLFFTEQTVRSYQDVMNCNQELFKQFFHLMFEQGIYLAPSAFEAGFISLAHDQEVLDQTISAAKNAFTKLSTKANQSCHN